MRWFNTEEICSILTRYEKVVILGDSLMRHVLGAMAILIRQDLGYGAIQDWLLPEAHEERYVQAACRLLSTRY
jgi:hypothetical protein